MPQSSEILAQQLGIAPQSSERAVLRLLIQLSAQVVGAAEGSLLVVDATQQPTRDLVFAMTVGGESERALESEQTLIGQRVPIGSGLTGLAALTREVQIGAPSYDGVQQAERGEALPGEPTSVIAAPMLAGDASLVGVVTAVSFEAGRRFSSDDALLYGRVAMVAGVVVDQQRRLAAQATDADRDPLEAEVVAIAERLAGSAGARLPELVRLMRTLEALFGSEA